MIFYLLGKRKMEPLNISLSDLTFGQKLNLLESVWADLSKEEQKLDSPLWHKDILSDREDALATGKVSVCDWEEAKDRIRKNVK
jgi:hypothetical protein